MLLLLLLQTADLEALSDRWLVVRAVDGHIEHFGKGGSRKDDRVVAKRLDVAGARWTITSADDPAYASGVPPARVGRKTKGVDFAGFVDGWKDGRTVNTRPDHVLEHRIYLALPSPLKPGATYTVTSGILPPLSLRYADTRSEAVHVNLIGYPTEGVKHGYVYHWMGELDSLDVRPLVDRPFRLLEMPSGATAYEGKIKYRFAKVQPETGQVRDAPPNGNYLKADVVECDFSDFKKNGQYVLSVEGVGRSFPFRIGEDVYREAFRTTARGLFHNRSGIVLEKAHTEFERPAPHNPLVTPGFKDKLVYTRSRFVDWKSGDHDAADKPAIDAGVAGPIDVWGWYQDAGDWDGYEAHLVVPSILMLAWELGPSKFKDGELGLPESGNGVPDLLDEAAWLPRFCRRLRAELIKKGYGSGGIGLRVCGDHSGGDGEGVPSYLDVHRRWIVSGEDPWSTYRYAGVAAQLAVCLKKAGVADPEGVDWAREAREAWAWAAANTRPGDEEKKGVHPLRAARAYAAATLWRLSGDAEFEKAFLKDTAWIAKDAMIWHMDSWGPWMYLLGGGKDARIRSAVLASCRHAAIETPSRRALRWGGNWWMPMVVGQQTTPWILEGMVGHALEPDRAAAYRASVTTSCDYVLGTNALNMTWVTGLGPRHPTRVLHLDAWYNGKGRPHPGIVPYGPAKKTKDQGAGPWTPEWAYPTAHPPIDEWPANERWFGNRYSPFDAEFTVHQNTVHAAAAFGWLCAPAAP